MSGNPPNMCKFCQGSFTRPDALKRHWNTCAVRLDASMDVPKIPSKSRGRRPKACDQCYSLRRACVSINQQQPCELCTRKKISCSYRRFARKTSERRDRLASRESASSKKFVNLALASTGYADAEAPAVDSPLSPSGSTGGLIFSTDGHGPSWCPEVNWLEYDFTRHFQAEYTIASPHSRRPTELKILLATRLSFCRMAQSIGIAGTFECGTSADRSIICQRALDLSAYSNTHPLVCGINMDNIPPKLDREQPPTPSIGLQCQPFIATGSNNPDIAPCSIQPHEAVTSSWNEQTGFSHSIFLEDEVSCIGSDASLFSPLQLHGVSSSLSSRCQRIINRIRDAILQKRQNSIISISWSHSLGKVCTQLFTAANAERFLALFWSSWYPNWPTIHQPTFDPLRSHIDLVTTMILMGACLSPNQAERSMASIWFDTIEESIFSADEFSSYHDEESEPRNSITRLNDHLGILQAGYCICLLQTWEGSRESKRRIRRHRYNSLIWLARDTSFENANLKTISTEDLALFDWETFILKESFIRIITYIYNLDSAYAMFCFKPPSISYNELHIDLSAPETCFQADSPEECFVLLKAWRNTFGPNEIPSLFMAVQMICSNRTTYSDALFSHMSVLNMFTIIHVLYAVTFQVEKLLVPTVDTAWLQKGLENWRNVWPCLSRDEELSCGSSESNVKSINRTGFTQHAPEIWFLAHSSLSLAMAENGTCDKVRNYNPSSDGTGMAHLRSMVHRFRIEAS